MKPVAVPTYRYTSPDFARRRWTGCGRACWQFACTLDHVANPGDLHEYRVGLYSVLIVRGDDGELRAFQNACRHRGSALCQGTGSASPRSAARSTAGRGTSRGRLREVPSRREFGVLNDDLPLAPGARSTRGARSSS